MKKVPLKKTVFFFVACAIPAVQSYHVVHGVSVRIISNLSIRKKIQDKNTGSTGSVLTVLVYCDRDANNAPSECSVGVQHIYLAARFK